jgi:phosphonate degradation associated HDIG domain protein
MSLTLPEIIELMKRRGEAQYGSENVSQLDHALQCAYLAELAGEKNETIAAALLHDLGHLIAAEKNHVKDQNTDEDDLHQFIVLPFLRRLFTQGVVEPIRLHVDAKRYLCLVEPGYFDMLSQASRLSLNQQGGVFTELQAAAFLSQPFAEESVRLRRYDDLAKVPKKKVPGLAHFERYLHDCAV